MNIQKTTLGAVQDSILNNGYSEVVLDRTREGFTEILPREYPTVLWPHNRRTTIHLAYKMAEGETVQFYEKEQRLAAQIIAKEGWRYEEVTFNSIFSDGSGKKQTTMMLFVR